ncbi:glycogen debranching enzyme [Achroia grisella]|uniref:glycogen debranching enzyme n=1 Tax=Achroia grisella TaxID=688607 RepID=UPI0027D29299|nr:glycogen debranching enzyme [Achroia grisella]
MAIDRCAAEAAAEGPQTRVLTLEHGEHNDATLYRFKKGYYLQFCPGPSLLGRKVFLYTNYVVSDNPEDDKGEQAEFVRNQYYGLEWRGAARGEPLGAGVLVTDTQLYCELRLTRAGSFHYYFVYDNAESAAGPAGSGWFAVPPTVAAGGRALPPAAVSCQTVVAKCLGPLPRWPRVLRVAREAGYTMLHFTPVQELGASDSSYSIANRLRLDPRYSGDSGREATFADVENVISKIRNEWQMASISDVVLNHTANETPWLTEHPEATYNCGTCPHLRPAALLDALLARLTAAVGRGDLRARGLPPAVTTHQHVQAIKHLLESELVPELRLHEMFTCDVDRIVQEFYQLARNKVPPVRAADGGELKLLPDPQYRRLHAAVDLELALQLYNVYRTDCYDEEARLRRSCDELRRRLEELNAAAADELRGHLRAAIDNCVATMQYFRLQSDGPKIEEVSEKNPLVPRYFLWAGGAAGALSAAQAEAAACGARAALVMAHSGWLLDADPLQDFAAPPAAGRAYLRRELVAWSDCVKLRYGARPEDSPFLWAHMREYVELTAELFDGLRLDNCHSTPLHVAEYMLDCARNVKPDLYVVAELFTNSEHVDNIFVNRLGISALIRESQSARSAGELARLVRRGARAVGALRGAARRPAAPRAAPALLLDASHDNPAPAAARCVFDLLPGAALAALAPGAAGSTRGYDDLVPHQVDVVSESRLYTEWAEGGECAGGAGGAGGAVDAGCGLVAARRALLELRLSLAAGHSELYVDQLDDHVLAVTRHHPHTRQSVIVVAHTAFSAPDPASDGRYVKPLRFEGEVEEILLEASLVHVDHESTGRPLQAPGAFERDPRYINGLAEYRCDVRRGVAPARSAMVAAARREGALTVLEFRPLRPGAVLALRVAPPAPPPAPPAPAALAPLAALDLPDLHALLYRCDAEERDAGGGGVYHVPGHGPLPYAGLQGVVSLLDELRPSDDLGHPLCENLRAGDWLLEYQWRRLEREPRLAAAAACVRAALQPVTRLPRYLVPTYAARALAALHGAATRAALARLGAAGGGCALSRALALTSVQLAGAVPSAPLPPPSPALPPPRPAPPPRCVTLAAGLPHFSVGHMRCWGRDTFIALRGLFLLTGRYQDARFHILGFAACLRHGLIPNLLDGGINARYNCRDAVWWWLQSIKQYCSEAPQGTALLTEPVSRLFPQDDAEPAPPGAADQPLHDVVQEALQVHFQGLVFRERNAGRKIDAHMSDKGFNVQIGVDPETGFPFGGNDANCGTWMDKMGSSETAGNRGRPATPRDGSAVEVVALAHSVLAWLAAQHRAGRYPHAGVSRRHRDGSLTAWSFAQWAERIRLNFERHYWVPAAPSAADRRPDLVHRRAIYKDSHGASQPWADYQLRCNFPVAMAVAPELFDPKHAWAALDNVERLLLGPLGVKTLDPADWAYRGDYDNANGGDDPSVAHGFNYHQGPEWVWPLGFYLRARLAFAHENGRYARTVAAAYAALGPLLAALEASPWRGLPELTNADGAPCAGSCPTQAWSSGAALEVLHALEAARRARPLGD